MLQMKETAPGTAVLWEDGVEKGRAVWALDTLAWGREQVKIAKVSYFSAETPVLEENLWAYVKFLWESVPVAVMEWNGEKVWFHKALQRSYEASQR